MPTVFFVDFFRVSGFLNEVDMKIFTRLWVFAGFLLFLFCPALTMAADGAGKVPHFDWQQMGIGFAGAGIVRTSKALRGLQAKKAGLVSDARAITDKAAAENRDLTDDEDARFSVLSEQIKAANKAIDREQALLAEEVETGANAGDENHPALVSENIENDPKRGFKSFGEFARAVKVAGGDNPRVDDRLKIGAVAPGT